MGYYDKLIESDSFLEHHGIMGMKWGVRRYQNPDGSLTAEGREHYGQHVTKKGKFRASNGVIIAPARSKGVDLARRASITPVGQVLASAGTYSMSRMTGRSVDSIKDQSRREKEALKEYFEMGGDKMLKTYLNEMNPNTVKNGKHSYEQAVKEYQDKWDEAMDDMEKVDEKWGEVSEAYKGLGKNKPQRILSAMKNETPEAKEYHKMYDEASDLDDRVNEKVLEANELYKKTGKNYAQRIYNNAKYGKNR